MKKFTCSYGTVGFVSVIKQDNRPLLMLDMRIKNFKVCNGGWKNHAFPHNAIINDKLYIDEATKDYILSVLRDFVDTTFIHNCDATNRGFKLLELKDINSNTISIQESSNVIASIWFGLDTKNQAFLWQNNELTSFIYPPGTVLLHDRFHLNIKNAKRLIKIIEDEWASQRYNELKEN